MYNNVMSNKILIVGTGKVGSVLAVTLDRLPEYRISHLYNRNWKKAERLCKLLSNCSVTDNIKEILQEVDTIFITVPDREIKPVYDGIYSHLKAGQILVHCSGALGSDVFDKTTDAVSIHPNFSFSSTFPPKLLPGGIYFGIEGRGKGLPFAEELIKALKGKPIHISTEEKPLYHLSAVIAANFTLAMLDISRYIYGNIDINEETWKKVVLPLVRSVLKNIENSSIEDAITGPIARGEKDVVKREGKALKAIDPELYNIYEKVNELLYEIAAKKNK